MGEGFGAVLAPADKLTIVHLLDVVFVLRPRLKFHIGTQRAPVVVVITPAPEVNLQCFSRIKDLTTADADRAFLFGFGRRLVHLTYVSTQPPQLPGGKLSIADVAGYWYIGVNLVIVCFQFQPGSELFTTNITRPVIRHEQVLSVVPELMSREGLFCCVSKATF